MMLMMTVKKVAELEMKARQLEIELDLTVEQFGTVWHNHHWNHHFSYHRNHYHKKGPLLTSLLSSLAR